MTVFYCQVCDLLGRRCCDRCQKVLRNICIAFNFKRTFKQSANSWGAGKRGASASGHLRISRRESRANRLQPAPAARTFETA
eukprot:7391737-Prymnesium_polylepis.1